MRKYLPIAVVVLGMFIAAMEALISATILPRIIASLGGMDLYPWIVNSFLLAQIASTPLYGKLCDHYGFERVYKGALMLFMLGSLSCGSAQSMIQLILARGLQGLGSAGLITLCMVYVGLAFPVTQRSRWSAVMSGTWAAASVMGPAIGAAIISFTTWRWAFYVNIPLSIVIFIVMATVWRPLEAHHNNKRLDWSGAGLFALGAVALTVTLLGVGKLQFGLITGVMGLLAVISLTLFYRHTKRVENPLLSIDLLKRPVILRCMVLMMIVGIFLYTSINFIPLFVQGALGDTPKATGFLLTAESVGMFAGSAFTALVLHRWGFRWTCLLGAVAMAGALTVLAGIHVGMAFGLLMVTCSVLGWGMGIASNGTVVASQAFTEKQHVGAVTALYVFARNFGGVVGLALMGGIQIGSFKRELARLATEGNLPEQLKAFVASPEKMFHPQFRASLDPSMEQELGGFLAESIGMIFVMTAVLSVVGIYMAWRMPSKRPQEVVDLSPEAIAIHE